MLMFALSDTTAKMLSPAIPALEVPWFRYLGGMLVLTPFLAARPTVLRSRTPYLQSLRALLMVVATVLLVAAVQRMPIAQATTLVFAWPIFLTFIAVIFGYLFFAEFPDAITLTGCAVVIVSGIVAARRSEPRPRRG